MAKSPADSNKPVVDAPKKRAAKVNEDITALLRAKHTLLWVVTREEQRVENALIEAAGAAKFETVFWDCATGLTNARGEVLNDNGDPGAILDTIKTQKGTEGRPDRKLYVLRDLHKWFDPVTLRKVRSLARSLQRAPQYNSRAMVILTPATDVPPELTGEATVIDYPIPDRLEIDEILTSIMNSLPEDKKVLAAMSPTERDAAVDAAVGLSAIEASNCYARSLVTKKKIVPEIVSSEKKRVIAREKVLTWYDPDPRGMSAIGGLDNLKAWLAERKQAFGPEAKSYGLQPPKGVMLVGIPGCLAGDTQLTYLRGSRAGGRNISLKDFYCKFNGKPTTSRPWVDLTVPTFLHSLGPDGEVFYNRVVSVLEAGIKPLIRVCFSDGSLLRLTANHPIALPGGKFVPAGSLVEGDTVLGRGSMKPQGRRGRNLKARPPRVIVNCKYHPYGSAKTIEENGNTYEYTRVARARLVVEARMNSMAYDEFVHCLKHSEEVAAGLKYLDSDFEVHHLDEDTLNDEIDNLMVLPKREHAREHGKYENFNVEYVREVHVVSVESDGEEMTYDIQMDMPGNNFVANGIIVHNTGKSLTAKCIATAWGMPLLRLDLGALKSKWIGESEANIRRALQVAVTVAPCILWADELEKALAGSTGPQGDGGVSSDALGTLLSWMQEREGSVFAVATANDITGLPPELLRKGRFDEIFFLDLPSFKERKEIAAAAVAKRAVASFATINYETVAKETNQFTGAEIDALVPDAMFRAFADGKRRVTTEDLVAASRTVVPLVKTSEEKISALREWAKTRARPASSVSLIESVEGDPGTARNLELD